VCLAHAPSGYKVEGLCPKFWAEIFSKRIAMDGLHLVAVGFTPMSSGYRAKNCLNECRPEAEAVRLQVGRTLKGPKNRMKYSA
jgi:hypothetical protein